MTNEQMYILIGVPGVLALLGILINSVLVSNLGSTLNTVSTTLNARMTSVESRMTSLESTMATRFDLLMGRLGDLEKEIHEKR